jgi:V8-like Glu-specific endopeptidase
MNGKGGKRPGSVIGTMSADDINYVSGYLAGLVKKNNIPPKILVVHRFTQGMVTNYKQIKLYPETQIVIDMDGWGYPAKKIGTYKNWIYSQPIQFTGFKLFYVNDTEKSGQKEMMSPAEVLKLKPAPIYIQYQ